MMIQDPKLSKLEGLERIREKHGVEEDFFLALSVFGTVLRTLHMFEEPDALGRRLV